MLQARLPAFVTDAQSGPVLAREDALSCILGRKRTPLLPKILSHRHLERGQILFDNTSQASTFAIITSGQLKLVSSLADGRQQIVGLLFKFDCIWHGLTHDELSVEAITDATVCLIPEKGLVDALRSYPGVGSMLLERIHGDLNASRNWALVLGRLSALEKIATYLLQVRDRVNAPYPTHGCVIANCQTIVLEMTRADIADYLGLTIETVSRCLTKLKVRGLIKFVTLQIIELSDPEALTALAEGRIH